MTEEEAAKIVAFFNTPETKAKRLDVYANGVDEEGWYSTANVMRAGAVEIRRLDAEVKRLGSEVQLFSIGTSVGGDVDARIEKLGIHATPRPAS